MVKMTTHYPTHNTSILSHPQVKFMNRQSSSKSSFSFSSVPNHFFTSISASTSDSLSPFHSHLQSLILIPIFIYILELPPIFFNLTSSISKITSNIFRQILSPPMPQVVQSIQQLPLNPKRTHQDPSDRSNRAI